MPTACRLLKLASSRMQIRHAAFVLTERAGKESTIRSRKAPHMHCPLSIGPVRMQIKRAAFVLTERAGKEGKKEPAPGTDSSLYLVDPELEFVVIYEDKATVEEVRLQPPVRGVHFLHRPDRS